LITETGAGSVKPEGRKERALTATKATRNRRRTKIGKIYCLKNNIINPYFLISN
jgi:hypothetical protein